MRSSILIKLIGLLSVLFVALPSFGVNKVPNLYTDQFHLSTATQFRIPYFDTNNKLVFTTISDTTLGLLNTATDANTASQLVKRDASGNFSAGTITANLNGIATSAQPFMNFSAQTTNYTAACGDYVSASGPSFSVTLPDATTCTGRPILVEHQGVSLSQVYGINTTGGQSVIGAGVTYSSGGVVLYTVGEKFWFRAAAGAWRIEHHTSDTDWIDLGTWMQYYTYTITSGNATLAAVYSPAITFTLVASGNSTAAATYQPGWIYTLSSANATLAATYQPAWVYTISAGNATLAAVYKDSNGASYVVAATIAGGTVLTSTSVATPPAGPGVLTLFSGTGDATLNYSSVAGNPSNTGTYTVQVTIAAGAKLTTTSTAGAPNTSGSLVKLAGTGDAVITYSNVTGQPSNTTLCTTAATIVTQTAVVMTCTVAPASSGTLVKLAGTGDVPLPYNAFVGEDTGAGTKAYRVAQTIVAQTTLTTQSEVPLPNLSSGKLGKISGTGDTVLTYSAAAGNANLIQATTTIPTYYGSPVLNSWKYRRTEGRYGELWINYYQAVIGVIGSGDYIFPWIPNTLIDSTYAPASQALGAGAQSGTSQAEQPTLTQFRWPAWGSSDTNAAAYSMVTMSIPWTQTQMRVFNAYTSTTWHASIGSTFHPASGIIAYNWRIKFPIQGWIPNQ